MPLSPSPSPSPWPELPYEAWKDTAGTLHMWLQIVGKVRLARTPWVNHQWHATLYPTPRGLTTGPIPHPVHPAFELAFDFVDHRLRVMQSDGAEAELELRPRSVADFHDDLMSTLVELGVGTRIHPSPNEVPEPIPFAENHAPGHYDAEAVGRFHQAVIRSAQVFWDFRCDFIGKCSPVHLFWGAMDLAVTRFSGRRAPEHPGGIPHLPDWVTREAYSHEVSSAGFWGGGDHHPEAIYYSYAYPSPQGFPKAPVEPAAARWDDDLQEFVLPYEGVRTSSDPEGTLRRFLETTYQAAAELGRWDREALEWAPGERPPVGGYPNGEAD